MRDEVDVVEFFGHPLIRATHKTTFEITKEESVSLKGDCIIGVRASKACRDIDSRVKDIITTDASAIKVSIYVGDGLFEVNAKGHPSLPLTDERSIVVRKSDFICPRTLAISSDKSAFDLPRSMAMMLRQGKRGKMVIRARRIRNPPQRLA